MFDFWFVFSAMFCVVITASTIIIWMLQEDIFWCEWNLGFLLV